jgi:transcriptional antiterminator RfaH
MALNKIDPRLDGPTGAAWFCLRSHPKHEHIAAAHLGAAGLEVYLPRIRFQRATRRGIIWFTEALFPTYFFARFELAAWLRKLTHVCGVQDVVHFGSYWPAMSEAAIQELRALVGADEPRLVSKDLRVGDRVRIAAGSFCGWDAVVTCVMSASQRVALLLDFLGTQTRLELASALVRPQTGACKWYFENAADANQWDVPNVSLQ